MNLLVSRKNTVRVQFSVISELIYGKITIQTVWKVRNFMYSVSTLETTIFRQISLFRHTFLCPWLILNFVTLMGANRGCVLPPIRVKKYGLNHELRKVDLKLTLTNKIISRKIVVSRVESLYVMKYFQALQLLDLVEHLTDPQKISPFPVDINPS